MPELPEVEIIKRQLEDKILQKKIADVWWDRDRMLRPGPATFQRGVVGKVIQALDRRAKYLFLRLDERVVVEAHLKMSGRFFFVDREHKGDGKDKYVHVRLKLEEGELFLSDPRTFGYLSLLTTSQLQQRLQAIGPEPLTDLTLQQFREIVGSSGRKIKELLLDQRKIAGIGNIYANDALWLARIHPSLPANQLSSSATTTLHSAVVEVLSEALRKGGSSQQWYRHVDGKKGSYQHFFKVYARAGAACLRHPGQKIQYFKLGGRGTFYCPQCQDLYDF